MARGALGCGGGGGGGWVFLGVCWGGVRWRPRPSGKRVRARERSVRLGGRVDVRPSGRRPAPVPVLESESGTMNERNEAPYLAQGMETGPNGTNEIGADESAGPPGPSGRVTVPAGLFSRFIKVAAGMGGAKPPFKVIDLTGSGDDGAEGTGYALESVHVNPTCTNAVRTSLFGLDGQGRIEAATARPERLLDYVDRFFAPEERIEVVVEGGADSDGSRTIEIVTPAFRGSIAGHCMGDVPRTRLERAYGTGPDRLVVMTNPGRRPSDGSDWPAWIEKGYTVVRISAEALKTVLLAARTVTAHGYRSVVVRFAFRDGRVSATVYDPGAAVGDRVALDPLPGSTSLGAAEDGFDLLYRTVESQLASLSNVKTEEILIVRHPAEERLSFLAVEKDEAGRPLFSVCQTMARNRDSSEQAELGRVIVTAPETSGVERGTT